MPPTEHPLPCVRIIVEDDAGRVLLLKRTRTRYADNRWCLPGGKVEYSQTVEEAARAELLEETGIPCPNPAFLFHQDSPPRADGDLHVVNFYFLCRWTGTPKLNPESSDFAWMAPRELDRYRPAFKNQEGLERYWEEFSQS